MGTIIAKIWGKLLGKKQYKITIAGIYNAGKTTILYQWKLGKLVSTHPTLGNNCEQLVYKNLNLHVWDLGGQESLRSHWPAYFEQTDALIFVIDSADPSGTLLAKMELQNVLLNPHTKDMPLLILANKQDLPGAKKKSQIIHELGISEISNWNLQECSGVTGEGLRQGLDWLLKNI